MVITVMVLTSAVLPTSNQGMDSARRMAVARAVSLVEKSAATYVDKRECFSCHHQALAMMAMSRAKLSGIELQPDSLSTQVQFSLEYFGDRRKRLLKGDEGRNEIKSRTFFEKTDEQAPAPSRARNDRPITKNYQRGRMMISLNQTTCP